MIRDVLILYATTEGQTRKVAEALAVTLRAAHLTVDVVNATAAGDTSAERYRSVIVAASVHAGRYQKPVRRWTRTHATALASRPNAFVSLCLAVLGRGPTVDRELDAILRRFIDATGWTPDETKIVAGALPYTKYSWWKRRLMRSIVRRNGGDTDTSRDYEYTDWLDLEAFANRFADRVLARDPAPAGINPIPASRRLI
jgi:menaquinone-dependent protoporphyrinogen oxidase